MNIPCFSTKNRKNNYFICIIKYLKYILKNLKNEVFDEKENIKWKI